jgi:hypothetical protein
VRTKKCKSFIVDLARRMIKRTLLPIINYFWILEGRAVPKGFSSTYGIFQAAGKHNLKGLKFPIKFLKVEKDPIPYTAIYLHCWI